MTIITPLVSSQRPAEEALLSLMRDSHRSDYLWLLYDMREHCFRRKCRWLDLGIFADFAALDSRLNAAILRIMRRLRRPRSMRPCGMLHFRRSFFFSPALQMAGTRSAQQFWLHAIDIIFDSSLVLYITRVEGMSAII